MSSSINRPTGQGYVSNLQRSCTLCGHKEIEHYGRCQFHPACPCKGFTARKLDKKELAIMEEQQIDNELKYVGEAWLDEFVEDFKKRD